MIVASLKDVGVPRLVRQNGDAEYQTLGLVVNLSGALISELAADKTGISVGLVVVDLFTEPQCRCREGVAEVFAQYLDGCRHHAPIILASEEFLSSGCSLIEFNAGVEHRGVEKKKAVACWSTS